jgi:hypothetical protein
MYNFIVFHSIVLYLIEKLLTYILLDVLKKV